MTAGTMTMQLIHGRIQPDAVMDGWGFDAHPITGLAFVHGTYFSTFTVGFISIRHFENARLYTGWQPWDDLILEIPRVDGLIRCGSSYYGDFEIAPADTSCSHSVRLDSS